MSGKMSKTMSKTTSGRPVKVCVAGAGAFGVKHLEAIGSIDGMQVVSLVESDADKAGAVAARFGIAHTSPSLDEVLARDDVDAVILCTPTQMHASQALACLRAGKHVEVEIPMADNLADAEALVRLQQQTGLIGMAGHTRRFNPGHRWIRRRIAAGELTLQHMDVQTYFFRRTNTNALGEPRGWTDHLLWHHACHTVDLFQYQTGETDVRVNAMQGPRHPALGIAMDMSIQLGASSGAICTLSLSFNNDGPLGTVFRYICDHGTYVARYDDLFDGGGNRIDVSEDDVSTNGIELQDRAFLAAIASGVEPESSFARVLPAYRTLDLAERAL
jgi:2-hydroxy-4-carboxymuconate semialdehyde hemiacetal dehydrogenase